MNVGELFVSLGFDVDDTALKDFNSLIVEGRNEILTMSAAATAGVLALNALFMSSAHNSLALKNFTDQTGESSEALQKWQTVIHETNPSIAIDQAAESFRKLKDNITEIRRFGTGPSGSLAMLGVDLTTAHTTGEVLEQIRNNLSKTIATYGLEGTTSLLDKVGIGRGAINALQLSSGQFEQMGLGGVVSEETIRRNTEYAETIARIDVEFRKFKQDFTAEWEPTAVNVINGTDSALKEFNLNLHAVFDYISKHQAILAPLEASFAVLAGVWSVATFPITAAFAALAFAINDVGRALRGLPTLTGGFVDTEIKGISTLIHDPNKFMDNLDKSLDLLAEKFGASPNTFSDAVSPPAPQINQTNHFHLSQKVSKEEIDSFLQDRIDDAHTQLNLGAPY